MNQPPTSSPLRLRLAALLLALATLVVYLPVVHCGFVNFDDQVYVTQNDQVKAGVTWPGIRWAFTTFHGDNWHPLTWLSHMLDCQLFGLNPGPQHFTNALFHGVNAALLLLLMVRLTGRFWPGLMVAALFAWHPLHVESVAWISERKDVLSTLFALLTLMSYAQFVKTGRRGHWWLAWLYFTLGLLAKPMLVTLPLVLLLLDYWPLQRFSTLAATSSSGSFTVKGCFRLAVEKIPFLVPMIFSCVMTCCAQRQAEMTLEQMPFYLRFEDALIAYGRYLLKMIWPANLVILYPLPEHLHWIHLAAAISAAALILLTWLAWRERNRRPYFIVGWLWFLGTLVPVIGFVKVGSVALADRYTYFPLIGIFIALVFGADELAGRFPRLKQPFTVAGIFILMACAALTERQLQFWHDSETLFRHDLAVYPGDANARLNLGAALEAADRPAEAMAEYRETLRLADDNANAHDDLGNLLFKTGQPTEALTEFKRAIALDPANAGFHYSLGYSLAGLGKFDAAMNELASAASLDPANPWTHYEMATVLLQTGQDAKALDELRAALRLQPDNPEILIFTARVLASDENAAARNGHAALTLAIKANFLTGGSQPMILDVLGMACAESGDFTNAAASAQNALTLATTAQLQNTDPIRQRLELYQKNQPWHESFRATNAPAPVK